MEGELKFDPVYGEERITVSGIRGLDMRALWAHAGTLLEKEAGKGKDDAGGKGAEALARGSRKDSTEMYHFMLSYLSSQGILMSVETGGDSATIDIPWLASPWDVRIAYTLLRLVRERMPSATFVPEGDNGSMDISEEAEERCAGRRQINIRQIAAEAPAGCHVPVDGCNHRYYMPNKANMPELDDDDFVRWSMVSLLHGQWGYTDLEECPKITLTLSDDRGEVDVPVLDNTADIWVDDSRLVAIADKYNDIKVMEATDFLGMIEGNSCLVAIDPVQFGLRKMPEEEWKKLWESFDKPSSHLYRTWLLRWNPAISSFTAEDYEKLGEPSPHWSCLNWSFFYHEGLKAGDTYFMERVGEGSTGLVFRGTVCNEAYEDSDWAGTDRKRYYADLTVEEKTPLDRPMVATEQLREAIPDVEWGHGHSGIPLTNRQAAELEHLWQEQAGRQDSGHD